MPGAGSSGASSGENVPVERQRSRKKGRFVAGYDKPNSHGARNDQVRTFRVRFAVRVDGSASGGPSDDARLADTAADLVDCRGHGGGALGGDDDQSHRGPAVRQRESPHKDESAGDGRAFGAVCMVVYDCGCRPVFRCGVAVESAGVETRAAGDGDSFLLFLYEAIHELVAPIPWICTGDFAGGRLDCDYRQPGLANADSLRGSYVVGRRI